MTKLFLYLANRSITTGFLILAVIGLRFLFRKLPKGPQLLLWALVALRLAVPVSLESAWSLLPKSEPISPQVITDAAAIIRGFPAGASVDTAVPASGTVSPSPVTPALAAASAPSGTEIFFWVCTVVWLLGMAAMLAYGLVTYGRLKKRLSVCLRLDGCVYICDSIHSPFVLGLIHPHIYLPSDLNQEAKTYVLAHERAHLRHGDAWWKLLGYLLLSVYWFHPLVWIAYRLFCQDLEMACDERAVEGMDAGQKKDYARALLLCAAPKGSFAVCPVAFSQNGVKARIANLLQRKDSKIWAGVLAALLAGSIAWCFATDPKAPRKPSAADVNALSALVIDEGSGQVLCAQNENTAVDPGRWAQLALAIAVVRQTQDPECVIINASNDISHTSELNGLSVKDHLYRMLLMAETDSTDALARSAFGSIGKAIESINTLTDSVCPGEAHFTDLRGEAKDQFVTASGLRKLIAEAMREPLLKEIWESPEYTVPATGELVFSRNFLLAGNPVVTQLADPRVTGGLSCCTNGLADSAVTAVQDERHLLCIVLGAARTSHPSSESGYDIVDYWGNHEEMEKLLNKAFE